MNPEEEDQSTSLGQVTQVCIREAESEVELAFADMQTDLKYFASKTGTIKYEMVMKWLEDTWKAIGYNLEPLYKVPRRSSIPGNDKKDAVSRCRLSHVLEIALNEAKDGLSVLYDQKKPGVKKIEVGIVLRQLEIAKKSITDQLNFPPIDTLPDRVLLHIFRYLSLCETIHFRRVCPRFQILLKQKCRSITSLKLFYCFIDRFSYISKLHTCQLSQSADDRLHLHHDGRADDLIINQYVFYEKPEVIHQIANQFKAIKTLVLANFFDTFLLSLSSLSVFTNLTTLVITYDYRFSWTSLTSFTSLRRLYLFEIIDDEEKNLEAAAIVLGRLTCLVTPSLSTELVPMLSVEMKQLRCDNLPIPTWIELCSRLSALTYLHIPFNIIHKNPTALELFRPMMSLPNLVELSLYSFSVLPSISQIREHSLKLPTVKKILFNQLPCSLIEPIIALFPALQLIIYVDSIISKTDNKTFAQFCAKFKQTDINVEHSLGLLEMTGPHWEKYKEWETEEYCESQVTVCDN